MSIFELKGFNSVFESTVSNEVSDNLVEFLDWGLLQKGNYFNTTLGEINNRNTDISRLQPSESRSYSKGKAWDSIKPNWVWQSGINHDPPPINVSGVYVNDVFYPEGNLDYPYYVDYYNGRVVFDQAIPTSTKVQVEHSHKYIHVRYANDFDGMKTVVDDEGYYMPESTVQTPCIAIETFSKPPMRGYQLGHGHYIDIYVRFHCLAKTDIMRNRLMDMISYQNNKTLILFDSNKIAESGAMPIDNNGSPNVGAMTYPDLVRNYPSYKIRLYEAVSTNSKMINNNLFGGVVRMKVELIKLDI